MFVRIVKAKDKKYAQVVESFRNGTQVSHRVLWSLGQYDEALAKSVSDRLHCWQKLERAAIIIQEVEESYLSGQVIRPPGGNPCSKGIARRSGYHQEGTGHGTE
jgi:hypothetical protein